MFDAGFWELLVIGVLALVVVGPERLPRLARTVGLWVGRARHAFYSVRDEIEREANAEGLRETEQAIRRSMQDTERSAKETEDEIRTATQDAARQPAAGEEGEARREPGPETDSEEDMSTGEDRHTPPDSKHG